MIYVEGQLMPVFRVLEKSRDRSKVIVFDRKKHAYAQRWLATGRLTADDLDDLHLLQARPERYAPNLEELHRWLDQHPDREGRGDPSPLMLRIFHVRPDSDAVA
jgi:hypothetical protein